MKSDYSKVLERFGESPNTDSEEFMKMLSEFHTSLIESIKKCPHPLPQCVAHLKPKPPASKPPSSQAANRPMVSMLYLCDRAMYLFTTFCGILIVHTLKELNLRFIVVSSYCLRDVAVYEQVSYSPNRSGK